jgi:hypothetical protein
MYPRVDSYGEQLEHLSRQYQFRGVVGVKPSAEDVEQVEECCVFYK